MTKYLTDSECKHLFFLLGKEAIIQLREEEFQAFLKQRRNKKFRERQSRLPTDEDDFDDDDIDGSEEKDTFDEDFEVNR